MDTFYDLLTKTEKQVYNLLVKGNTNKEIATSLAIKLATVKAHVASIMSKAKQRQRSKLIAHYWMFVYNLEN